MAAQEKQTLNNEKLLTERARILTDMIAKLRASLVVNRRTAVALESLLPGVLPSSMPVASFTEDDSVTNVKPLMSLLNKQFEDVVYELYHVMSSRAADVSEWVQKSSVDMEGLREAWQAVELITEVMMPASANFIQLVQYFREKDEDAFLNVMTAHRAFEIAEDAEKLIEEELREGSIAAFTDDTGIQRHAILVWNSLFRNKEEFSKSILEAVEEANEILFEGDNDDFEVESDNLDRIREDLGFPITTAKSEIASAYLFMVERALEEMVNKGYSFDTHFTKQNFAFDQLLADDDYVSNYVQAAGACKTLFDKVVKDYKVNAENPGQVLSIATQLSDAWLTVETAFRTQVRLYTEMSRITLKILGLCEPVMLVMERVADSLKKFEGAEGLAEDVLTDCRIFNKSNPSTELNDLY